MFFNLFGSCDLEMPIYGWNCNFYKIYLILFSIPWWSQIFIRFALSLTVSEISANFYFGLKSQNFPILEIYLYDISIKSLAEKICTIVGYSGEIEWDISKPDGVARKLLDNGRIDSIGWKSRTNLESGLEKVYKWYLKNISQYS